MRQSVALHNVLISASKFKSVAPNSGRQLGLVTNHLLLELEEIRYNTLAFPDENKKRQKKRQQRKSWKDVQMTSECNLLGSSGQRTHGSVSVPRLDVPTRGPIPSPAFLQFDCEETEFSINRLFTYMRSKSVTR